MGTAGLKPEPGCSTGTRGGWVLKQVHAWWRGRRTSDMALGRWNKREVAFISPSPPPTRRKHSSQHDSSHRCPSTRAWAAWLLAGESAKRVFASPGSNESCQTEPCCRTTQHVSHPSPTVTKRYSPTTTGSTRMAFRSRPLILARFRLCPGCGYLRCG